MKILNFVQNFSLFAALSGFQNFKDLNISRNKYIFHYLHQLRMNFSNCKNLFHVIIYKIISNVLLIN